MKLMTNARVGRTPTAPPERFLNTDQQFRDEHSKIKQVPSRTEKRFKKKKTVFMHGKR